MVYKNISLNVSGALAEITLNRPKSLNALSGGLLVEMMHALEIVQNSKKLKLLKLSGNGRAFCAGADLLFFESIITDPKELANYIDTLNHVFVNMENLDIPTVSVVHGFALAGGLELMLSTDITLSSSSTRFGDQHINFGLIPGGGSTRRLEERIGKQSAIELMISGRWMDATEAEAKGLIYKTFADEVFNDEVDTFINNILDKSYGSLTRIKNIMNHSKHNSREDAIRFENNMFSNYVSTHNDPQEGLKAFKEKRAPNFS